MPRTIFLTFALLLALPAFAHAAGHVEVRGDTVVYTGSAGADRVVFFPFDLTGEFEVGPFGPGDSGPSTVGPGCAREDRTAQYGRASVWCRGAITKVVATFGAGDDQANFLVPAGSPITKTADMGDGDDQLFDGYAGGVYRLGGGDDEAQAKAGSTIDAGAGDDDLLCGESNRASRAKGVFTLDGGLGEDRICGGRSDDRIEGGAADDKIFSGEGDDVVEGDSGDDQIDTGDDDDRITPGRGEDEVDAGAGKDTIRAKDRDEDDLSCGSKRDTVFVDRIDLLSRCETVRR